MSNAYERGFTRVAALTDLRDGEPRLYRTGGWSVIVLRNGDLARAADATALPQISSAALRADPDVERIMREHALPVELRGSEIWVCVDLCAQES